MTSFKLYSLSEVSFLIERNLPCRFESTEKLRSLQNLCKQVGYLKNHNVSQLSLVTSFVRYNVAVVSFPTE